MKRKSMELPKKNKGAEHSNLDLEIFERVLDEQVVIAGDLKLDIKLSVASLEAVKDRKPRAKGRIGRKIKPPDPQN